VDDRGKGASPGHYRHVTPRPEAPPVLDRVAVREPTDAAYLSGSQRFRVAVALALGIGQYVGGAPRGQRVVLVDEGFGSLDADGIDAVAPTVGPPEFSRRSGVAR
jgi:ABC-type polar amino acid transport system ATPase subunit